MRRYRRFTVPLFFLTVFIFFFHRTVFLGFVPFPGDLLIAEYNPWRTHTYLGYAPAAYPNKAQYFDAIRQLYPWRTLTIEALKRGELPFWNPYNFSGTPLLANVQSAVFYPPSILYVLMPQVAAWTVLVLLQPLLASIFTYLFARKVGIGTIGSMLTSLAFSYSLFMMVFLEYNTIGHTILWLPFILLFVERLAEKVTAVNSFCFLLGCVSSLLAGHVQMFGFVFGFVIVYAAFRKRLFTSRFFLLLLAVFTIGSVQLLPTVELIAHSARSPHAYDFLIEKLLIQPWQATLFVSADFFGNPATRNYLIEDTYPGNALYVGLIPFAFALLSLPLLRKNILARFFWGVSIILSLAFIRSPVTEFFYRFEIPIFSTGSPTNAIFLLSLSLAVLAGFGIEQWMGQRQRLHRIAAVFLGAIFLLVWVFIVLFNPEVVSARNFLYATLLLSFFFFLFALGERIKRAKRSIAFVFVLATIVDLFYFFQKFNPFVPASLVFPNTPVLLELAKRGGIDRFWGYGKATIDANLATQYRIFSPDGYDPLYPRRYGEFIQSSQDGKIKTFFTTKTRSDAIIAPGYGEDDFSSNVYRLRVLDMLGVRYVLDRVDNPSSQKTFPTDRFGLVYDKEGWRIFENRKAAARAFLAAEYKVYKSKEDFERFFFSEAFDPTKTVLLEEELPSSLSQGKGNVTVRSYLPNKATFRTSAEGDALLFLSDTFYPGWRATIDGRETKIYRANYAFRAVLVPKGERDVVFSYQPQSFPWALKTTIISLGLVALAIAVLHKRSVRHV